MSKTNIVPISDQPATQEENPNRLSFTLEEMLKEFENGAVPRSKFWQELITALYDTANHVVTGVTAVADVKPDNIGNIPLLPSDIDAPPMVRMEGADERERQSTEDVFGRQLFYGDACKVVHQYGHYYEVLAGTAYVAGIKFSYPGMQELLIDEEDLPTSVWLDVSKHGDSMSDIKSVVEVVVSEQDLTDYIDNNNIQHYLEMISDVGKSYVYDCRRSNAGSLSAVTHATRAMAEADDNANLEYIRVADYGGALYEKVTNDKYKAIGDSLRFTDRGGNNFVLAVFRKTIPIAELGSLGIDDTQKLIDAKNYLLSLGGGDIDITGERIRLVSKETENSMFQLTSKVSLIAESPDWEGGGGCIELAPKTFSLFGINASIADDLETVPSALLFAVTIKNLTIIAENNVGIGLYCGGMTFLSEVKNVVVHGTSIHAVWILRTWFAKYENIFARSNYGAGITIGKHPDATFSEGAAVNGINFRDLEGHSSGRNELYDYEENLDTGYGLGIYGSIHSCSFSGVGIESNYGPGFLDRINYGSYTLGPHVHAEKNDIASENNFDLLAASESGSNNHIKWSGISLQENGNIKFKNTNCWYVVEVLGIVSNSSIDISEVENKSRVRLSPLSRHSLKSSFYEQTLDSIAQITGDLNVYPEDGTGILLSAVGNEGYIGVNNPYKAVFIPFVTTSEDSIVTLSYRINGETKIVTDFQGPFTAYQTLELFNISAGRYDVIDVRLVKRYTESCPGIFAIYYKNHAIK